MTAVDIYRYFQAFKDAYDSFMKPFSVELGIPRAAMDILLFLANNPNNNTSGEICAYLHMKPGMVSFHTDKLTTEGYIERIVSDEDRRKIHLRCTEKALPIVERGRMMQDEFRKRMFDGFDPAKLELFSGFIDEIEKNLENIVKNDINL